MVPNSFFANKDKAVLPKRILFLDFDDTVASPARKENGEYDIQPDGSIGATHLDKERFRTLVETAILNDVPLYFVSGRADLPSCIELLESFIESVDGFHPGVGGFKRDSIYFISRMVQEDGEVVRKEISTKAEVIHKVHQEQYRFLSCDDILFIDDIQEYLDPVTAMGYRTVLANPGNLSHFNAAEDFMRSTVERVLEPFV